MAENILYKPLATPNKPPAASPIGQQPVKIATPSVTGTSFSPSIKPVAPVIAGQPSTPSGKPQSRLKSKVIKMVLGTIVILIILVGVLIIMNRSQLPILGGKVTLTYWGLWEDKKIMQPVIDAFEKQHPNITINYEEQDIKKLATAKQPYPTKLIARVNSGDGPDIFRFQNTWYPMLSKILAPFPKIVITTSQYSTTFFPVVSKDLIHGGAIYGVPMDFDILALFTNPEIFNNGATVPTDWNDFYSTAKNLTVKGTDGTITTAGAAMGTMSNVSHATDILALLLADSDVDINNIAGNSDNAGKALVYYANFANSTGAVWDASLPMSMQMFAKGNLAMYIGYSWDIFTIQAL